MSQPSSQNSDKRNTILIVDDVEDLVLSLCYAAQSYGYNTIPAFDGVEALELLRKNKPDLIITDLMMPKLDGFEPLQSGTTLIEAARSIVEGVLRDLPYPIDQFKKVATFFDSLGISVLGTGLQLKRDTTKKEVSTQAFLHDTLTRLWQDVEGKTGVLVILLDDLRRFYGGFRNRNDVEADPLDGVDQEDQDPCWDCRDTKHLVGTHRR